MHLWCFSELFSWQLYCPKATAFMTYFPQSNKHLWTHCPKVWSLIQLLASWHTKQQQQLPSHSLPLPLLPFLSFFPSSYSPHLSAWKRRLEFPSNQRDQIANNKDIKSFWIILCHQKYNVFTFYVLRKFKGVNFIINCKNYGKFQ